MKKLLSLLLIPTLALSLTACQQQVSNEDPQTVIDKAWEKLADKNVEYNMGRVNVEGEGNLNFAGSSGTIEGNVDVEFDTSSPLEPKTAIKLDLEAEGSFEGSEGEVGMEAQVRTIEGKTYFFLDKLKLNTGDPQTDLMGNFAENFFKSQWIALPESITDIEDQQDFSSDLVLSKQVAELSKKHNFFEVEEDLGNRKYQLRINPEKLKTYLIELSKLTDGEELTSEDLEELDEMLDQLKYSLQVQIDNDYDLTWIMGDITATDPQDSDEVQISFEGNLNDNKTEGTLKLMMAGEQPGELNLEFTANHDDSTVNIQIPADAEELDLDSLFGLGAGGLGVPGAGMPGTSSGLEGLEGMEGLDGLEGLEGLEGMEGLEGLEGMSQ